MKHWVRWQDWTNVVLGTWLFFSPWMFGYGGGAAANAWVFGLLAVIAGFWALADPRARAAEWMNVAVGSWMFFAPWIAGFGIVTKAGAFNAWVIGAAIAIIAGSALASISERTERHA